MEWRFRSGAIWLAFYGIFPLVNGLNTKHPTYAAKLMHQFGQDGGAGSTASSDYPLLSAYPRARQRGINAARASQRPATKISTHNRIKGFVPDASAR